MFVRADSLSLLSSSFFKVKLPAFCLLQSTSRDSYINFVIPSLASVLLENVSFSKDDVLGCFVGLRGVEEGDDISAISGKGSDM